MVNRRRGIDPTKSRDAVDAMANAVGDVADLGMNFISRALGGSSGSLHGQRKEQSSKAKPRQTSRFAANDAPLLVAPVEAAVDLVAEIMRTVSNVVARTTDGGRAEGDEEKSKEGSSKGPLFVRAVSQPYPTHPYLLQDCGISVFFGDANLDRLQSICNAMFSTPTGGAVEYTVLSSKVVIFFADILRISTQKPPGAVGSSELDLAIWAVALRKSPQPVELVFIPLYLFVDSGAAQAAGREIYGFPKHEARFKTPDGKAITGRTDDGGAPVRALKALEHNSTGLSVRALTGRLATEKPDQDWRPVLQFTPAGQSAANKTQISVEKIGSVLRELFYSAEESTIKGLVGSLDDFKALLGKAPIRMAFLKQFPSAANADRADYQAVVEAAINIKFSSKSSVWWNNALYDLTVTDYPQIAITSTLGLNSQRLKPVVTIQNVDLVLGNGSETWSHRSASE